VCISELMMGAMIGVLILPAATARAGELGSAPPWENVNLPGFAYVDQPGATAAASASIGAPGAAAAPSGARSNASTDIELAFWRSVHTSGKAEEYSADLARFQNGNFVSIGRIRLAALQTGDGTKDAVETQSSNPALPTRETEEQLRLDQRKRSAIQKRLLALGYFDWAADGNFNDNTRCAIERGQAARHCLKSGYFNRLQYQAVIAGRLPSIQLAALAILRQPPAAPPQPTPARSAARATAPAPSDMSSDGGARARRASIGVATMKDDGTIVLDLVAVNGAGVMGDARLVYPPGHSRYREVLEHVSGLRPGEHKPVPPWPDCDPLAGVPGLDSYWNVKVPGKYWIDMVWNDNEWEPAEPIPMPLHHATRLELTNLSAFPSLVSHRGRRIRFTVEITARDIRSSGGARPEWRATYRARAIDTCILE
jgi:hypothetical protein